VYFILCPFCFRDSDVNPSLSTNHIAPKKNINGLFEDERLRTTFLRGRLGLRSNKGKHIKASLLLSALVAPLLLAEN
jgi:hypothetical protein